MTNCIGSVISVDCGEFGYYQGRLISLDADSKDIVLGSAFREGIPLGKNVTLNGAQIVSLKVLKAAQQLEESHVASTSNNNSENKLAVLRPNGAKQNGSIVHRSKSTTEFASMEGSQNRNRAGGTHGRTLGTAQNKSSKTASQRKPSSVSSTSEEGQSIPADVSSKPRTRSRRVRRSESEHIHSHPVGVSETPHFRSFEPQVPLPREVMVAKVKNRCKTKGPSGNPLLDSKKLHSRIANGNDELVKPIDFELLNTDFDFDANLEQFKRENLEDEYYESVEKQKMSQNFAHYENIIADPARVTSWTNILGSSNYTGNSDQVSITRPAVERRSPPIRSISFCPSGYETTYDGFPLPVLDVALKKKYLSECCSAMGSDVYYYLVADRLIMWLIDVVGRLGITLDRAVVLASSTTPLRMVDRFLSHLDNRGVATTLYGKFPSFDMSLVSVVDRVSLLPAACKIIIVLTDELTSESLSWLGKQTSSHIISLECAPSMLDYHRLHVLMLGVLTSGMYTVNSSAQPQVGKTSFAQLCATMKVNTFIDSAVCDVGAPFSWIAEDGKANLQQAFSTTLMRRLC
uniref:LSM14 domain-containing protein n=2 Tax=Haemonchus contortus TaxID=6289 RepID=A0A6F7NRS9_HAECO|nr:DFDF motif domain containing protein [Haemonchus contortus]